MSTISMEHNAESSGNKLNAKVQINRHTTQIYFFLNLNQ